MTGWVVWQKTDFCTNVYEERLYNAVVGVIYCFCYFNLKEGRSRYRMATFYAVIIVENLTFVSAYYWAEHLLPAAALSWFSLAAMAVVVVGTAAGLTSMLLYYRFYHPAGPILPCVGPSEDKAIVTETVNTGSSTADREAATKPPDFVIKNATYVEEKEITPEKPKTTIEKSTSLKASRSFKNTMRKPPCPPVRKNDTRLATPPPTPHLPPKHNTDIGNSSAGSNSPASPPLPDPSLDSKTLVEKVDSAYGTDSNRTASRNTESSATMPPTTAHNHSGSSYNQADTSGSPAFNNETYMSIGSGTGPDPSYMSVSSPGSPPASANNTYQSVHPMSDSTKSDHNTSQESQSSKVTVIDQSIQTPKRPKQDLLKRSPVLRGVTGESSERGRERLHAPLTIIIPNISNQAAVRAPSQPAAASPDKWSDKTISLDILNPGTAAAGPDISALACHDYENLALVNINRAPLGPTHWRTYSDMANSRHDDSTKYEKSKLNFTSSSDYR